MSSIIIAYYTGVGHTKKLAEKVLQGVLKVSDVEASLMDITTINDRDWHKLDNASAIIFGSPTYMGGVAGPFKSFMDKTSDFWVEQKWSDKIAAGFTIGTSESGDKLNSLIQMSVFAAQHGMVWVGLNHVGSKHTKDGLSINKSGSWLGLMAQSDKDKSKLIPEYDAQTARLFGERIAHAVSRWNSK